MNTSKIDGILDHLTPDEGSNVLCFIDVCERNGNTDQAEADERRRRILARRQFLELSDDESPTA